MRYYIIIILFIRIVFPNSIEFDGNNAFIYIKEQCEFGPRYPGSEGHKQLINYLQIH